MNKPKLFLIDANSFCYRAYYAIRNLSTSYGQPTNAIYGFTNMLKKILQKENPEYIGICFDVGRKTFRQEKFTEYKIHRPPMPDDLKSQMSFIKEIISAYNIPIFEMEGFEADDVIATLARKLAKKKFDIFIVSQDKDILQLVDENIKVYSPAKEGVLIYDEGNVRERFKLGPKSIADLIGLMGDSTDNIPGVKGVGETTAVKLLEEFDNLDNLFDNLDKVKSDKLKELLLEHKNEAIMSKELAKLDREVPLDLDIEKLKLREPDYPKLFELFKKFEFNSFLKDLPQVEAKKEPAKLVLLIDKDKINALVENFAKENSEIALAIVSRDSSINAVFSGEKKVVYIVESQNLKLLAPILEDKKIKKIVYDFKATLIMLQDFGLTLDNNIFDLMLAAYIIDPSKTSYAVDDLSWEYLKEAPAKLGEDYPVNVRLFCELAPILEKIL
ncbi:MAG: 5'-3' exonuclease H3TH domain-containing protein, partial [Candidatus Omnitrophica bacterium]|nr:5'-3' exonuclease H3TH domain-containing protein [Candidatus Omnitrophota bacterium]